MSEDKKVRLRTIQVAGGCNATLQALDVGSELLYYACDRIIICWNYAKSEFFGTLEGHSDRVNCIKAVEEGVVISGGCDSRLILWTPGQVYQVFSLSAPVVNCAYGHKTVISLTNSGKLTLWKHVNAVLEIVQEFEFGTNLQESAVLFSTGNRLAFATGGCDSLVHIYIQTEKEWEFSASLHGHMKGIRALDWKDGLLASASHDSTIRLWRVFETPPTSLLQRFGHTSLSQAGTTIKLDAVLTSHQSPVQSVRFNVDGAVISSSLDFTVMVWEVDRSSGTWNPRFTMGQMTGNKHAFFGAAGDPSGKHIFAHSYNGAVYHWKRDENAGWTPDSAPSGHLSTVTSIAQGPGFILTSSLDQTCRLFSGPHWTELSRPLIHGYDLNCVAYGHNLLVCGGDEKVIRVFEPSLTSARVLDRFAGVSLEAKSVASSQALGLSNKPEETSPIDIPETPPLEDFLSSYTLWPECRKLFGHPNEVSALAFGHDSTLLASACKAQNPSDAEIYIWDMTLMTLIQKLSAHKLTVSALQFSPNDEYLLSVGRDRDCALFKQTDRTYSVVFCVSAHARIIYSCSWSPLGTRFLTVSRDKRVKEWDLSGECIRTYTASAEVTACTYLSPAVSVIGLSTGEIQILDMETQTILGEAKHAGEVTSLSYIDGLLSSAGTDFTLRVHAVEAQIKG